jgi:dienelactone hydrolase
MAWGAKPSSAEPPQVRPEVLDAHRFDARYNESLVTLEAELANGRHEFQLTVFRPSGPGPFPVVVYHHGRGPERSYPSRQRGTLIAGYFIRRGLAVLMPTRVGYGGLGVGFDPERGGSCGLRDIEGQANAIAAHTAAALDWAGKQAWLDAKRVVLAGGSVGGHAVIANSAVPPRGLVGVINFAGGAGGSPRRKPGEPCNPARFIAYFGNAGAKSRVPTLWVYAENDRYWGARHPVAWHQAFVTAGGNARFVQLPPVGEDGHQFIGAGFSKWRPPVDAFLASLGLQPPRTTEAPPASGFAPLEAVDRVPVAAASGRKGYERFLERDLPRAFVIGPRGTWLYKAAQAEALREALEDCRRKFKGECRPYAVDDQVVWKP